MGRLPRVYIEEVLYYVTLKGGYNQNIFITSSDYNEYISLIDKYKTQYGFKLFSFVLLPTHLCLLIELKNNVPISDIMRDIDSLYTKGFNSRHNQRGHLFQERFKTVLIEKEPYLLQLLRHMCLIPQSTKLILNSKDYPYSSYSQFLQPGKRQYPDISEEVEEVFKVLGGREKTFQEYVTNQQGKEANEFGKILRRKRILGSNDFVKKIKKIIDEDAKARKEKEALPRKRRMFYAVVAGVIISASIATVGYFYRRSLIFKNEYDKTAHLYQNTLRMLKREKDEAMKVKEDIEGYQWKIELTEKALKELGNEREKVLKQEKEISGYTWNIKIRQIGGPKVKYNQTDVISFDDSYLVSANMKKQGFSSSKYSKRELKNGSLVWETIQKSPSGETVSWQGKWDGKIMKGIMSRRSPQGMASDFSFVSFGERARR